MVNDISSISTRVTHRAFSLIIACVILMGLITMGVTPEDGSLARDGQQDNAVPIYLPIEIMGEPGTTETVTVNVPDASGVTGLWMQVHNLSYDNKGSVKINNGNWIDLTNSSVDVAYPEVNIGGIGGGYSTIRITVPLSGNAVVNGTNTIQFRFNQTDGLSSGWRVLDFNFLRNNGSKAIPENDFIEDDPATWAPILTSSADLQAGENLWYTATLVEGFNGPSITATCNDCHTEQGRDLKYFNYSNKSIVERARFHGLSEREGEQIASWIRALDLPAPGRPWNPPYQPGPGLDDKPVEEWSAGAGLEWVLDDDSETLPYLFPNGILDEVASTKSTLNMRELPLAIQFPDWNRWLPLVHPKDFWGNAFLNSEAWQEFNSELPSASRGVNVADRGIIEAIRSFDSAVTDWRRDASLPAGKTPEDHVKGNLGLQLWQLVKVWDFMQTYHLEDHGDEFYEHGEKRTWVSEARNVFNVAPHISSAPGAYTHGTEALDKFFSHAWYMYQLVINPGNREPLGHRPVDWKYQFGHIGDYSKHTNLESGNRLIASYIKMIQMLDNDRGINENGWYIRHAHPYWFMRSMATESSVSNEGIWGSVPREQRGPIAEVMVRSFLKKSLEYEINEWPRGQDHHQLEPQSYTPVAHDGRGSIFEDRFNYADNFYRLIPELLDWGVAPSMLDSMATWGEDLWPSGDWEDLVDYSGSGGDGNKPTLSISINGSDSETPEQGGNARVTISRSGSTSESLNVSYSLTGTAIHETDYTATASPITMASGDSQVTIRIDPIDDSRNETDETVIITLQSSNAYAVDGRNNRVTIVINDDDGGTPYASGDATGDGTVSALDAAFVLRHVAEVIQLEGVGETASDVSGDQSLSAYDASLILQYITGLIDCFPVEDGCTIPNVGAAR